MTNEISLQLWILVAAGGFLLLVVFVSILVLALLNRKWKKQYIALHNEIKNAILHENAELRNELHDEAVFKENLRKDLEKSINILKVRVVPVDNEITQICVYNKNVPLLTERFEAYKEWIFPNDANVGVESETKQEAISGSIPPELLETVE